MTTFILHDGPRFQLRAYPRSDILTWSDKRDNFLRVYRGARAAEIVDAYVALRANTLDPDAALTRIWGRPPRQPLTCRGLYGRGQTMTSLLDEAVAIQSQAIAEPQTPPAVRLWIDALVTHAAAGNDDLARAAARCAAKILRDRRMLS